MAMIRGARGRVVFISSIGARGGIGYLSPYNASKAALSAVGDSLRQEMRPFGVDVSVIEPGSIATEIWDKGIESAPAVRAAIGPEMNELYGERLDRLEALARKTDARGLDPETVARGGRARAHRREAEGPLHDRPRGPDPACRPGAAAGTARSTGWSRASSTTPDDRAGHRRLERVGAATARRLAREPGTTPVLVARREDRLRGLAATGGSDALTPATGARDDGPRLSPPLIAALRGLMWVGRARGALGTELGVAGGRSACRLACASPDGRDPATVPGRHPCVRRTRITPLACVRVRVAVIDMGTNSTRLLVADVVDGRCARARAALDRDPARARGRHLGPTCGRGDRGGLRYRRRLHLDLRGARGRAGARDRDQRRPRRLQPRDVPRRAARALRPRRRDPRWRRGGQADLRGRLRRARRRRRRRWCSTSAAAPPSS